jgi:hypothetical protein
MTSGHAGQGHSSRRSSSSSKSRRSQKTQRSSRRRITFWVIGAVVVLAVLSVAWVGVRALLAKNELEAAVPLASQLKTSALANDTASISRQSSELHKHATAARDLTGDPIWRLYEFVPVLGPNLTAAREISEAVADLSTSAVSPLTRLVSSIELSDFKPVDGAISLQPLVDAQSTVSQAATALARADTKVRSIDVGQTLGPVRSAVEQLGTQITELLPPIEALDNAITLAPKMLGQNEARNYLLIFQNPAELRSTGGIPGAMALIHTEGGKIELVQQSSAAEFPQYAEPVLELPDETRGLYGDLVGEYIQDVTLTPNFELSAQVAQKMWEERFGTKVDGVISLDPVALSYILGATGPVNTALGESLTSDNAVSLLLNEVYIRYPNPAQQDIFFAASAKAVFDKVSGGDLDPTALISALSKAGSERRLLIWSERTDEQNILADTALSGGLVGETDNSPSLGLFLNDATGAKMDYYLRMETSVGATSCRKDGLAQIGLSVTLTNTAPEGAGRTLPDYVTGAGDFGVTPGNIRTLLTAYGSPGMVNLGAAENDVEIAAHSASDTARPVNQVSVELAPGESRTIFFGFLGDEAQISPGSLQTTPIINMNETSELALTCESALW